MSLLLLRECLDKQKEGSPCHIFEMSFFVKRIGTDESIKEIRTIKEFLYPVFTKESDFDQKLINAHWLANYGVTSWEGIIDDESGEEMEFTERNRLQLFLNKAYFLSLNNILITHAVNYENYLNDKAMEDIEAIKKQ